MVNLALRLNWILIFLHDQGSSSAERQHAVAVLIIGAARALVWPEVCRNIHQNLLQGGSGIESIRTLFVIR